MSEHTHESVTVTDQNFEEVVLKSKTPVLVDFWAPWCGPCKTVGPTLEEIASEHKSELKVAKVNVDEQQAVAGQLGVRSIPTMVLFKDGKALEGIVGAHPKDSILDWVGKHVSLTDAA